MMATNLESAYHLCQLSHPLLKASGSGSIVFISSVCGLVAVFSGSLYAMTKGNCFSSPVNVHSISWAFLNSYWYCLGAINQLTKNLACEWARDNIRSNSIAPWYIRTSLTEGVRLLLINHPDLSCLDTCHFKSEHVVKYSTNCQDTVFRLHTTVLASRLPSSCFWTWLSYIYFTNLSIQSVTRFHKLWVGKMSNRN